VTVSALFGSFIPFTYCLTNSNYFFSTYSTTSVASMTSTASFHQKTFILK
jgi:hypothetical protein